MCLLGGDYISASTNLLKAYCSSEPPAVGAPGHCTLR
jgi:hypothetical protein